MSKKSKFILFFLTFSCVLFYGSSSFALEVSQYPHIPFAPTITQDSKLPDFIVYFFTLGVYLAGALAVISLIVGGIQLVISGISPDARNNAIDRIKSAILGLVLLLASVIIIQSINPNLKDLKYTVTLKPVGGLQLTGNNKSTPAPQNVSNIDDIRQDYSNIEWPAKQIITDPTTNQQSTISNCDSDNLNAIYVVYYYNKKNFEDFRNSEELKCGGQPSSFVAARSYIIKKQIPGVYFYDAPNCKLATGGDSSSLPQYSTKSIPEWSYTKAVKSILVVNGPDPKKGPFFGAILFNDQDYKTNIIPVVNYIDSDTSLPANKNYSYCNNTPDIQDSTSIRGLHSVVIYQWAGFKDNSNEANVNCSVDLYSRSNWSGGYYQINSQREILSNLNQFWAKELETLKITYPQTTKIPIAEQQQCDKFYPTERCLQSFEIKGNCLVLIVSDKSNRAHAQAFPISPRLIQAYGNRPVGYSIERGTPELENDYITSGYSYFIKVIPLSVKITE